MLGGPAPYWASYSYDATGNRTKEVQHGIGAVAADTTRTYSYPAPGHGQHQLASVTQTGAAGDRTDTFSYDADGNTTSRDIGNADQTLTWDAEGHLESTTDGGGKTTYAYDVGGNRLLRRDPQATTLYLPGMELRLDKITGQVGGTRYYSHNGTVVAMRTAGGVQFLSADPHGSAELSIDASSQAESQRRLTPFGQFRGGPTGVWPNDKGFVGGTIDPSGLTQLGARAYDPDTGRFVSVDPVFDPKDPQSWNAYAYSDNNPETHSDPTGTRVCEGTTGDEACAPGQRPDGKNIPTGNSGNHGCLDPTCTTTNMGRDTPNQSPRPHIVFISPHVAVPASDPNLKTLQQYWEWANRTFVGLNEAAKWEQICEGGDSPCNYRLKDVFLRHNAEDWLSTTMAHDLFVRGGSLLIGTIASGLAIAAPTPCISFVLGTKVILTNGSAKAIEKVKKGDRVLAVDPKTGKIHAERVTNSFGGIRYRHLVKVTLQADGVRRPGQIIATEHHRFWAPVLRKWLRADQLRAGAKLQALGRASIHVVRVTRLSGHPVVRDLTVARYHTFFVKDGRLSVLVHNSSCRVVRNLLQDHEADQAKQLGDYLGAEEFVGPPTDNFPGIDGWLDGEPVSLKQYTGGSPRGVLTHALAAEDSAGKAGYTDVTLYIEAKGVSAARISDFAANGPLSEIAGRGPIGRIYIQAAEEWVIP